MTAWRQRLARPGLFPVIKPLRMSTGYPSSSVLSTLILLTHAFHAETSSFLRRRGEETRLAPRLSGGGWVRCAKRHLPHLSDDHSLVLPCPSLSDLSAKASNFTPERLLSCCDCATGPFSGSQEIPHSAEVMGGGDVAAPSLLNFSNCCFLFAPPPILKNNKSPHSCGEPAREEFYSPKQRIE